jgi:hypothetical protein
MRLSLFVALIFFRNNDEISMMGLINSSAAGYTPRRIQWGMPFEF